MARRSSLFRHILVPHDFSEQATVALTTAGRLAKAHGGKLSVLYVLEPFYWPADVPFGMPTLADLVPEQKRLLEQLVMKTLGRNRPSARCESRSARLHSASSTPAMASTA